MNNSITFKLKYDGPALESHEMDVKDLAPALLSIGELFEEANALLGYDSKISVNIKGAPKSGSLDIDLSLVNSFINNTVSFLNSNGITALISLINIVGISKNGLIGFISWLKGRKIKNVTTLQSGNMKITLEDNDSIEQEKEVIMLYQNVKARKSLQCFISNPLKKEGINSVGFYFDNNENIIKKEQSDFYDAPLIEEEIIGESESEVNLQLVGVFFQEGNKWKFSDGNSSFFAEILDNDFVYRVQKNEESFTKDDILKVILHRKQSLTPGGIKTIYTIKKIISHRSSSVQIKLPFKDEILS